MKNNVYFSAYPLKALNQDLLEKPANEQAPFRAMLNSKTKSMSRIRVSPMINPYRQSDATNQLNTIR
jgi:hypothetical protein